MILTSYIKGEFFSARQAAIASFFGGVLGSGFVLFHNARSLRRDHIAWISLGVSVALGSVCLFLEWALVQRYGLDSLLIVIASRVVLGLLTAVVVQIFRHGKASPFERGNSKNSDRPWPNVIVTGVACMCFQIVGAICVLYAVLVVLSITFPD